MDYAIRPISPEDREAVMAIFNHYAEHSFAAYPERRLPPEAFDRFLDMGRGNPAAVVQQDGAVVGFGLIRTYNPMPAFARTAEVTYFIHPDHTGRGAGKLLLAYLEQGGRDRGIRVLLANISSLNPGSVNFHRMNGFTECGRFRDVGVKNGRSFDVVWMQKGI